MDNTIPDIKNIIEESDKLHQKFGWTVHDRITSSIYHAAGEVAENVVVRQDNNEYKKDLILDKILTSKLIGIPVMILSLAVILWITIAGANFPSSFLAALLMGKGGIAAWLSEHFSLTSAPAFLSLSLYEILHKLFAFFNSPWWLTGFFVDGVYLGLAWVVAVMLPPMAIFFPLFTLLEDLGFLPRIAFNLDRFFRAVGAHGKQALTMAMGFGCNAAGIIACRIIDSPREKLIAILTNNFVPCNGRWPTMIMIASLFVAAAFPAWLATLVSVGTVTATAIIGVIATLAVSFFLSRTILKGVSTGFTLEMPPYRPPQVGRILYTSFIDRTLHVLKRAVICAAPAGGIIWILGAVRMGDISLFQYIANFLNPAGHLLGMDGVILLAFIFAIPANEIVVPTIIMGYMNASKMTEIANPAILFTNHDWTIITAVCVILFSLLHYPCTTTTLTIWSETRSIKWTLLSNLIPLAVAVAVCFLVAQGMRLMGLG